MELRNRNVVAPPFRAGLLLLAVSFAGCGPDRTPPAAPSPSEPAAGATVVTDAAAIPWEDRVAAWKRHRHDRLERTDGWLTLVGLSWLEEGDNRVGSAPDSRVLLPEGKAPALLGVIHKEGDRTTFRAAPGVTVASGGAAVTEIAMTSDRDGTPTPIETGSLTFTVIERAERLAVRVRDSESETLRAFRGLDYYPLDPAWRIDGRFEPAAEVGEVSVPNAVGYEEKIRAPGHVVFELGGQEFRLLALDDTGDGRLFLVFGDPTNGSETYGGGRFLYTDEPRDGRVEIDFNRAYNPPCVFTPYATCPLPPPGNRLSVAVRAGEKRYSHEAAHAEPAPGAG
ncbi:MAG: DUF1684 domain-containing protein [Thermoanaerobaculia bacterium]